MHDDVVKWKWVKLAQNFEFKIWYKCTRSFIKNQSRFWSYDFLKNRIVDFFRVSSTRFEVEDANYLIKMTSLR